MAIGMSGRIPILIYHGFYRNRDEISAVDPRDRRYYLSTDQFASHLDRLAGCGFAVSSVENASEPQAVALSFDDGHISNYDWVWPMLVDRGFSGSFFIVADWIGRPGRMDAAQLRKISAGGMSIGSHGLTHTDLTGLPEAALDRELSVSKNRLEQLLGIEVPTLALPRGRFDQRVIERARAAGYRRICTSRAGLMNGGFTVPRLSITSRTTADTVEGYARRNALLIGRTRAAHAARRALKGLIGLRNYDSLAAALKS